MIRFFKFRRNIEIKPFIHDGENLFVFSCQADISESLAIRQICAPLLRELVSGLNSDQIEEVSIRNGIDKKLSTELINMLDNYGYLETAAFSKLKKQKELEFRSTQSRKASHAGAVYPADALQLKGFIENILSLSPASTDSTEPICLIAPHIDYRRGQLAYAYSYRYLKEFKPDICIIFGTSHKGGQSLFQLSLKDFESPLQTIKNHREFSQQIIDLYGAERALVDEFLHKNEHSIELQIPFLSCLAPETKIVPVLVNSFYPFYHLSGIRENSEEYSDFIKAFCQTYKDYKAKGHKILIIAGVDMAHIGSDFGDSFVVDQQKQLECESKDREYLECIKNLSSDHMFRHITSDQDQRRICGFACLHSILDILNETESNLASEIVHYQQAVDEKQECLVSFASGIICRR